MATGSRLEMTEMIKTLRWVRGLWLQGTEPKGASHTSKQKRRRFTPEQKAAVLRRHLVDKAAVSDLCDEYKIQPSLFYGWQRQLLENMETVLDGGQGRRADGVGHIPVRSVARRIARQVLRLANPPQEGQRAQREAAARSLDRGLGAPGGRRLSRRPPPRRLSAPHVHDARRGPGGPQPLHRVPRAPCCRATGPVASNAIEERHRHSVAGLGSRLGRGRTSTSPEAPSGSPAVTTRFRPPSLAR